MAIEIKRRRGTTVDHSTFTGAAGEITIDLDKDTAVIHDGATVGGFPLLREDLSNLSASTLTPFAKTIIDDTSAAEVLTTLGVSDFARTDVLTVANLDALKALLSVATILPAGLVSYFAGPVAPSGWLVCDGSLVSRTTYADLFAAISVLYGVGDGSTTFQLPDLRGEFIRCNDEGRGIDTGRAVGSTQAQNVSHRHDTMAVLGDASVGWSPLSFAYGGTGRYSTCGGGGGANLSSKQRGWSGPAEDVGEVRPRNVSLLPCIKY